MNITCPHCESMIPEQNETWPCPICGRKWKDWRYAYLIAVTDELQFFSEPQDPVSGEEIHDYYSMMQYEGILENTYEYSDPSPAELGYTEEAAQWPPELVAEHLQNPYEWYVSGQFTNKRFDGMYWWAVAKCTMELHKFLCISPSCPGFPMFPVLGALPLPMMLLFWQLLNGGGAMFGKGKRRVWH